MGGGRDGPKGGSGGGGYGGYGGGYGGGGRDGNNFFDRAAAPPQRGGGYGDRPAQVGGAPPGGKGGARGRDDRDWGSWRDPTGGAAGRDGGWRDGPARDGAWQGGASFDRGGGPGGFGGAGGSCGSSVGANASDPPRPGPRATGHGGAGNFGGGGYGGDRPGHGAGYGDRAGGFGDRQGFDGARGPAQNSWREERKGDKGAPRGGPPRGDAKGFGGEDWGGGGGGGKSWDKGGFERSAKGSGGKGFGGDGGKGFGDSGKGDRSKGKGGKDSAKGGRKGDDGNGGKGRGREEPKGGSKGGKEPNGQQKGNGKKGGGEKGKTHSTLKVGGFEEEDRAATAPSKKSRGTGAVSASYLSTSKFSELPISAATKRALAEGFGYELMTNVQAATVGPMLAERDVVARAKTGTGKTLAFLVPIVEKLAGYPSGVGGNISAVILSPTRELAAQISEEAQVLLKFHGDLGVACFYGGTNIKGDHTALRSRSVDILVATPGRLQDHLDNTPGFRERVGHLYFLALDEADQLLDMGFRDAILKILKALPPPANRQGALFSATFPAAVGEIAKLALKGQHEYIDTVKPDEEVTPDQIDQSVCTTDMEGMTELLWYAVNFEMRRLPKEYKIMVFFTTARATQLYSELFGQAKVPVLEVHSRKSQAHRNRCTQQFRESRSGIVFSSDVSARGLDYPDVSAVIQVGIPSSREQYIHRLGRTGRAGKSGRCILLLHDFEEFFLRNLKDLPLKRLDSNVAFSGVPPPPDALWVPNDAKSAGQAYQAWLGYYNSVKGLGWPKDRLVEEATRFAASIGAVSEDGLPPPILKKTVGMMGLKGVPGLNIVSQLPYGD